MRLRCLPALLCLVAVGLAAWFGRAKDGDKQDAGWIEVAPGILRTASLPAGYAIVDGKSALLLDAPQDGARLKAKGVEKIEGVRIGEPDLPGIALRCERFYHARVARQSFEERSHAWDATAQEGLSEDEVQPLSEVQQDRSHAHPALPHLPSGPAEVPVTLSAPA